MTIIAAPLALPVAGRKTVRVGISMTGSSPCWRGAWAGQRRRICKSSSLAGGFVRITGSLPSTVKKGDAALICLGVNGAKAKGVAATAGATTAVGASEAGEAAPAWMARRKIGRASKERIGFWLL